ncbi:MAG: acetyltransferase [Phycisphaerales bacterium]|nr:acetyltransferase [Phycisphaerales bacterium]
MPAPILIRSATLADAARLADYNAAMALETEHKSLDPATLRAGVERAIAQPQAARYHLAEMDGQVVGQLMVTFEWSDWRNADFWWIQSVYVHPDFRSAGVFKALYRHVEALAREAGACGLRLYVERENTRAQEVYCRLGMGDSGMPFTRPTGRPSRAQLIRRCSKAPSTCG